MKIVLTVVGLFLVVIVTTLVLVARKSATQTQQPVNTVTATPSVAPTTAPANTGIYLPTLLPDGRLVSLAADFTAIEIRATPTAQTATQISVGNTVSKLLVSPDGKRAIVKTADGLETKMYSLAGGEYASLDPRVRDVLFSDDGQKIIYHFYDPDSLVSTLSLANPDGSQYRKLAGIKFTELKLIGNFYPPGYVLALAPTGLDIGELYLIDQQTGKFALVAQDVAQAIRLPGSRFAVYATGGSAPQVTLLDLSGGNPTKMPLTFTGEPLAFVFGGSGNTLLVATGNAAGEIKLYSLDMRAKAVKILTAPTKLPTALLRGPAAIYALVDTGLVEIKSSQ